MTFTEKEQRTVRAVFGELIRMDYNRLNTFFGTITIQEMNDIYWKLKHEPYCKRHGISVEEMTEDDFMQEYLEENEL